MHTIILSLHTATSVAAPIALATPASAEVSHIAAHAGAITGHVDSGDAQRFLTGLIATVAS